MSILYIDTSNNKQIKVGLRVNKEENWIKQKIGLQKAQVVLPMVEKILKKYQLKLEDLTAVEVNVGPGSFTGLRVGIAVANALSFALKVPVNGKKVGEFVEPVY